MRRQLLLSVSLLGIFGVAAGAVADTVASSTDQGSDTIGDIIVTAQRKKQNLEDVPIAVSSFSPKDIEQMQINGTADIPRLVPNFFTTNNVGTGSGNVNYLRGLGQTESFPTFDPQIGTYVDDIYIGRESASNFGLFDEEQIQVLRGPQGTLFGRNSTGGAIVITLAKPADEFGGYVEAGYGKYNRFFGKASVDIPVNDHFLTKTSVYGLRDDGYVDDVVTHQNLNAHGDVGVREAFRILPGSMDNVVWDLSADYAESTYNAEQNTPIDGRRISYSGFGNINAPGLIFGGTGFALGAPSIIADAEKIIQQPIGDLANGEDIRTWGGMSNIQATFDAGTLNFITGYRGQNQVGAADFPFPGLSGPVVPYDNNVLGQFGIFLNSSVNQYSQEVKWTGNFGDQISYTAGLFYLYEENTSAYLETATIFGILPAPALFAAELPAPETFHNTTSSEAAYGQVDYKPDDHLTVTVGARFTEEHKSYEVHSPGAGFDTVDVQEAGNRTRLKTDQLTPHFSVQYRFDPELMIFASATRGFQGGGWNSLASNAFSVTAFGPETLWTYETGFRYQTEDHKLRLNGGFFYNDVKNYQLVTLGPGQGNFVTENAADFVSYGIEGDVAYKPIDNLTLSGTLGLQNGYYSKLSDATQAQRVACLSGTTADCGQGIINNQGGVAQPEYLPPITVTAAAVYDFKFPQYDISPNVAVQVVGANHVDTSGLPAGLSATHMIFDAGVTLRMHDLPLSFTAECQNCGDTNYISSLLFVKYYNTPGIWDIKARYDF